MEKEIREGVYYIDDLENFEKRVKELIYSQKDKKTKK